MLQLRDLHKSFGSIRAVDGVSLEVAPGEVFGLLGPNGAGKSTTIGMAVGLITPDRGSATLMGLGPPTDPRVRRSLGVAPQALALYEEMTGLENLRFFGRLLGLAGRSLQTRCQAVLEMVGLGPRQDDRVKGYSGGMKRRLNLAAAILHEPPVLLLDEPTAGVDPQSRNNILLLVRELASRGTAVVYTTHYMEEAARLCSRVAIIDHGRMLALGPVADMIARHGGKSIITIQRAGRPPETARRIETDDPMREIHAALAEGDVANVRIDRPDLESVFLSLTGRSLRD